jgi:hypothetical protein
MTNSVEIGAQKQAYRTFQYKNGEPGYRSLYLSHFSLEVLSERSTIWASSPEQNVPHKEVPF